MNNNSIKKIISPQPRYLLWRLRLLWLGILAPLFFITYNFANRYAAQLIDVRSIYFEWEKSIPFVPWTIIPYWSLDLFYGISFLFCASSKEINTHGLRLLSVQIISVICFIVFPLTFAWQRPPSDGIFQDLFNALAGFDLPFNQAPSLHVSLTLVIGYCIIQKVFGYWKWLVYGISSLIIISVLTTYQHHFIDIPTGFLVGFIALWLFPNTIESPLFSLKSPPRHYHLAIVYGIGAVLISAIAWWVQGIGLWLFWMALSLFLVALNYLLIGENGFQKVNGKHSLAVKYLFLPYLIAARINAYLWTRKQQAAFHIMDNIFLGRLPSYYSLNNNPFLEKQKFYAIYDLSAEIEASFIDIKYDGIPCLDLVPCNLNTLLIAANKVEELQQHGNILVCCALGYSRSAAVILTWLLITKRAKNIENAENIIRQQAPHIVIHNQTKQILLEYLNSGVISEI